MSAAPRTELELMLAGELYLAADPELLEIRLRARRIVQRFNASGEDGPATGPESRRGLLVSLFGALGDRADVEPPFHCDYGVNIRAGHGLFMNFGCVILDCNIVTIGNNVLMGPGVHIYAATHPTDPAVRAGGRELGLPVTIGSNVWIGGKSVICPNVTIGDGAVIGAGSVVTRDVPAGMVVAGNPARVMRSATGR